MAAGGNLTDRRSFSSRWVSSVVALWGGSRARGQTATDPGQEHEGVRFPRSSVRNRRREPRGSSTAAGPEVAPAPARTTDNSEW